MKRNLDISPALRQLLISCHTFCSVDCCRVDAFEISEGSIERWLDLERIDRTSEIAAEIGRIKAELGQSEGEVMLTARGLESTWCVEEFQTFWDQLESAFSSARNGH